MTEPGPDQPEAGGGAVDGKACAHQRPDAPGGRDDRSKNIASDDALTRANQAQGCDAVARSGGGDLHRAEDRAH